MYNYHVLNSIASALQSILSKLHTFGSSGSSSPDIVTVQGVAGMVALKIDGSAIVQPVSQSGVWTVSTTELVNSFRNIASASTTVVKSGAGTLAGVIVNKAAALSSVTIYDNTLATGTKIATITHPLTLLSSQYALPFNCAFTTGLTVVTSAADDVTVIYR